MGEHPLFTIMLCFMSITMILTLLESLQSSSDGTLKEAARDLLQLSSEYLSRFELSIKDQIKIKIDNVID